MKNITLAIAFSVILIGCSEKKADTQRFCDELMQVDREFSNYSIEHGKNAAFEKFAAGDVTFLAQNSYPMVGIELLKMRQSQRPDTGYVLTWEPTFARAAKSGEFGYTYGVWTITVKADTSKTSRGTYVTIWMRDENAEWKYVLDTGQEGLGEEKK